MSSLYRKYRPNQFDQVIGQEHIVSSLTAMLASDRIGHAFLFSGPRGTGKTTVARLLARSLNCLNPKKGGEPCGKCEVCLEIANGQSVDVAEIDAASNRGIDEIRELREKIAFAPARSKYKVYIIDEVHMLTKEAFNALLKTLEEPPSHAIFILATTELHKVPETIISRCQRYQFHRASPDKLTALLQKAAKAEGVELDKEAAQILSERAEGSYRDALTMLGNVQSAGRLDGAALRQLIGLPPQETLTAVANCLEVGEANQLTNLLAEFINNGGDLAVLVRALANNYRQQIFAASDLAATQTSAKLLEQLLVMLVKARQSIDATSLLTAGLVNLALESSPPPKSPVPAAPPVAVHDIVSKENPPASAVDSVSATPAPVAEPGQFWPNFLEALKEKNHALYAVISSAKFEGLTDDKLVIAVKFRFYSERLFEPKNRNLIESIATGVAGRPIVLECLVKADLDSGLSKEEDLLSTVVEVFEINE